MSVRASTLLPSSCSGAMYGGLPKTAPAAVSVAVVSAAADTEPRSKCATPKSRIFSSPSAVSCRFEGLRSRWITPCSCAATSPRASCEPRRITSFSGSGPLRSSYSSVGPTTSSITKKSTPSALSKS
jgi:hypothetical protein